MVETLAEAWRAGWRLRVRCAQGKRDGIKTIRQCLSVAELDVETLVWTRGRDFRLSQLTDRMKCPGCGSRKVTVMFEPPTEQRRA